MNKEFKTKLSPCTVTEEELSEINRLTVKELKAEDVYVFNVILCDNEIDRDCERFDKAALEKMAGLFVGVTGIFDHNPGSVNQTARIFSASCVTEKGRYTSCSEEYSCVKAKAYMPRTEKNKDLIAEIDAGIKKEVSVSCAVKNFTCSVCGKDMRRDGCSHVKGAEYDGKLCHCILSDVADAYEWSFVAVPAQVNAGVTKSYEHIDECIKAVKSGESVTFTALQAEKLAKHMERLEKEAHDGKLYRNGLVSEIVKFAVIAVPELDAESIRNMCVNISTRELVGIKDAFRKKAGEIFPFSPQLKAKTKITVTDNSDYRI